MIDFRMIDFRMIDFRIFPGTLPESAVKKMDSVSSKVKQELEEFMKIRGSLHESGGGLKATRVRRAWRGAKGAIDGGWWQQYEG